MRKGKASKLILTCIILVTTGLVGCSLSTDQVNMIKEESGESIRQVKLDITDAELLIKESNDLNVHAQLSGSKASADQAVLTTSVKHSILEVKAAYVEGSYIDLNKETLNDQTGVKLTLSLPKKQFDQIQVNIPKANSSIKIRVKGKLENIDKKTPKVDSLFGTIYIKR
ncbi:hypothetical protein SAMN05444392_102352 [Seinonella peptonophila]|uniref:Lipoprotein n=1 Tax=Seinonella peptonophila TaxID=112248 RepID=A0A1M4VGE7_9BACL|nr:hypothetical protein [Seinonella peptonophila]SHE68059.1 hypothetical protein SAMN05444392_102352 [Seinonella peptonophila]